MNTCNVFRSLQHYLEANRLKTVVTADLVKALNQQRAGRNQDGFFNRVDLPGARRLSSTVSTLPTTPVAEEAESHGEADAEDGRATLGLFNVPVEVAISTASGTKTFPITVSKQEETFSFPADSKPLLVLFDKGDKILKSVDFHKTTAQWIYQLLNAEDVPDRADAAQALPAGIKGDPAVVAALGEAAVQDRFWGVRNESLLALGRIGGSDAEKGIQAATVNSDPWVRETAISQLGHFRDDAKLAPELAEVSRADVAYRVRSAALIAYGQLQTNRWAGFLQDEARIEMRPTM